MTYTRKLLSYKINMLSNLIMATMTDIEFQNANAINTASSGPAKGERLIEQRNPAPKPHELCGFT